MPGLGSEGPVRRNGVQHDGARAGGLAGNGHLGGISTKLGDVRLHPVKGESLVKESRVDNAFVLDLCG